jgi:hypothetical protein
MYKRDVAAIVITLIALYVSLQSEGRFSFRKAWYGATLCYVSRYAMLSMLDCDSLQHNQRNVGMHECDSPEHNQHTAHTSKRIALLNSQLDNIIWTLVTGTMTWSLLMAACS